MSEESPDLPEGDQRPRLGIRHFAQWTAWTAVMLGLGQLVGGRWRDVGGIFIVSQVTSFMIYGAVLTGLTVCIWRWWRGTAFTAHPGEWLLAILGLPPLLGIPFFVLIWPLVAVATSPEQVAGLLALHGLLNTLLVGSLELLAFWRLGNAKQWRVFFVWLFLAAAWSLLQWPLSFITGPTFSVEIPLVSVLLAWLSYMLLGYAVWADRRAGRRRPWTHWVGVAAYLALFLFSQFIAFWIAYFPDSALMGGAS